jgi:hypothetical protein
MKKFPLFILLVVVFLYSGITLFQQKNQKDPEISNAGVESSIQSEVEDIVEGEVIDNEEEKPQFFAELYDVSDSNAKGQAYASYKDGSYQLNVVFQDLADPEGTDFYEGWVVRKSPLSVISTGVLTKNEDGIYINKFSDERDLSDHVQYVLTLEPDDGNPAPAKHILEGEF